MRSRVWTWILLHAVLALHPALAQRHMSEEGALFHALKAGVFTIYTDKGQGTGFLVHPDGLVATNAHVLGKSEHIRVVLDESTKVEAFRVVQNDFNDVAIVRVNPQFTSGLPVLPVSEDSSDHTVGERVLAIGSPLNQEKFLTTGVISKVEKDAVLSDVNISPGSSGSPLLNLDGVVIAVNTFGLSAETGAGLSGSIRAKLLHEPLHEAIEGLADASLPSTRRFPLMPRELFPAWALKAAALQENWDASPYVVSKGENTRNSAWAAPQESDGKAFDFDIRVFTPPFLYWALKAADVDAARKRKERIGGDEEDALDLFGDLRTWVTYGGQWTPTVTLQVLPNFETGIGGVRFQDDLVKLELHVDGQEVTDLQRGLLLIRAGGFDVAQAGIYTYSPEVFRPKDDTWPIVELLIWSSSSPDAPHVVRVPRKTLERVVADFEPYYWFLESRTTPLRVGSESTGAAP